jgi:hypothetical protein
LYIYLTISLIKTFKMSNDYSSPDFMGNQYSPSNGGTMGGGESLGTDFNPNDKLPLHF